MLRGVPVWSLAFRYHEGAVCLSSRRRRIVRCFHCFRAHPLAASAGSAAARPVFSDVGSSPRLRAEKKRNLTGGFYEIPTDDPGGSGAGRHSERDFAFG